MEMGGVSEEGGTEGGQASWTGEGKMHGMSRFDLLGQAGCLVAALLW